MAQIEFDELVKKVNELTISEQRRLYALLDRRLAPAAPQAKDGRAPLIVTNEEFTREMKWLDEHRQEYAGQWIALKGDRLIASGASAADVYAEADSAGIDQPLITRVDDLIPFAGV
ncbi:MAG: hypothetical protein DMF61_09510 [Blastocatellia bacterium AA13]|nr:MAG: hypothetical protein DMF61_09510 [Blastocatellia bacterium AA13]